jgi:mannose-6-phosphate isomerase-like protein (cupin superfamily)
MEAVSATHLKPRVLGSKEGIEGFLGSIGVRFMVNGAESGGGFSLVEHAMSPRALAAPLHRHLNEDEYSFVLDGKVGALLGEEVVSAGPGTLIFKPRNQWHTFWNDGEKPAKILEIISPAGFEEFFRQVLELGGIMKADPQRLGELSARYGLEMDPSSVPSLVKRFGLRFPGEPTAAP